MKDYRLIHFVLLYMLISAIFYCADAYYFNLQFEKGMKVYCHGYTYIAVDLERRNVEIFDIDSDSSHPVLPRIFKRGNFHLHHIQDDFYSIVNRDMPGEQCIDHMDVSCAPDDSEYIKARFKLGHSQGHYLIVAKRIQTNTIYTLAYPREEVLFLPKDKCGYRFSIMPASINETSLAGIIYGFSPTLKYLNLRDIQKDVFSSGGAVEISLPLFEDGIFDLWCINGDIMQIDNKILNDKIIWHGNAFTLFERVPEFFRF
ncbi:MAG: hypothetical protein K2H71_06120 [Muribaculaceae bacterium]|nr:hypothetical protein [Muribaculaceae bacterium]